jgi:hypothetical protein
MGSDRHSPEGPLHSLFFLRSGACLFIKIRRRRVAKGVLRAIPTLICVQTGSEEKLDAEISRRKFFETAG